MVTSVEMPNDEKAKVQGRLPARSLVVGISGLGGSEPTA